MLDTLWQFIINTPWWVFILLGFLIWMGIKASRPRTVKLSKLFMLPIFFTIAGITNIVTVFQVSFIHLFWWVLGIMVVSFLAYLRAKHLSIQVNRAQHTLIIPGTYITLVMIIIIFTSKYYFAAMLGWKPELAHSAQFAAIDLFISGCVTGWFIGNLVGLLQHYKKEQ